MGSSFSFYIFALLTLLMFTSNFAADAEAPNRVQTQAQRFIRGFNLSSRNGANNVNDIPFDDDAEIVEKYVRFPSLLSDSKAASSTNATYLGHHTGYFTLNTKRNARMFYYFFESRKKDANAPVVVWLNGGPGCSSSLALFYENGPFKLADNLSLVWNDFGWDQESNIIYLDQPIGTGFSYSTDDGDIPNTSEEAAVDFYNFIQAFFRKHPEYANNDFYITGESYAGHYIPAFAARVHHSNKINQGRHIKLQGMGIGNGLTNSGIHTASYPDYAINNKLINQFEYNKLKPLVSKCLQEVNNVCEGAHYNLTACAQANTDCEDAIFETILKLNPRLNYYDIRKNCTPPGPCYDMSNMERFLNKKSVKNALGVDERIEFVACSDAVYEAMFGDVMRNLAIYVPELLKDGIKLLIYAGEYDLLCNWLGNYRWVVKMSWWGQRGFSGARNVTFKVDGVKAGWLKSYGPLTFLNVRDAGHLVPMDQPKVALQMFKRWTKGCPL